MRDITISVQDETFAVLQRMSIAGETPESLAARNLEVSVRDYERARGMPRRSSPVIVDGRHMLTGRKVRAAIGL